MSSYIYLILMNATCLGMPAVSTPPKPKRMATRLVAESPKRSTEQNSSTFCRCDLKDFY